MIISCFPTGIVNLKRPGQGITDLCHAGFDNIIFDINMCCSGDDLERFGKKRRAEELSDGDCVLENPEELSRYFSQFLQTVKEKQLHLSTAYAPYLLRNTKRADLRELFVPIVEESIHLCGKNGCRYLVVRPIFAGIESGAEWDSNREYYLHLAAIAKEHHVMLLLENQCRDVGGHLVRGICSDGIQAAEWVDKLNEECGEERFGFCMDVGACNLCGQNMYDFADALGNRIKAVILCDCNGSDESALLPFTAVKKSQSQTDWLNLIRGLREIGFDGELIINIGDTASAFSPILRPELMRMAKAVADYFKWQIEIENLLKKYPSRVLFGAGNMCRNYMKCYGEKYPPLFTCDNNRNLWETDFCGLTVKAPEALKDLPDDCAIFICNIYYREIEAQLRQMGIQNPIEYFNDEYMPTFYFDRLENRER